MHLSDKNIEALLKAAQECDAQMIGYGDVILLCGELQKRRAEELVDIERQGSQPKVWEVNDEVTNPTLFEALIARIKKKEYLNDKDVLALFHALQFEGYFQTITFVDRTSLDRVVHAIAHPDLPHLLREMQVTRGLPTAEDGPLNPIDQLVKDANRVDPRSN